MEKLDDASSIASFEDIGATKSGDKTALVPKQHQQLVVGTPGKKEAEPEEVPDVLYCVQYRNTSGRLVDAKFSDQPIDISKDGVGEETSGKKKPVIEIVTKVTSSTGVRKSRRYQRRRAPVFDDSDYSDYTASDSESDDGRGNNNLTTSQKTEMIVHSKYLKNALSAVVSYYPEADFSCDRLVIPAPYHGLILHRDALSQYKHNQPACHSREYKDTTNKHIDILLDFIDRTYSEKIQEEEHRHANSPPAATFQWYWMLFKPGEVFYVKRHQQWTPLVISRVRSITTTDNKVTQYNVEGWQLRYNHGKIQRQMRTHAINNFSGEQAIHSLPVIPARFLPRDYIPCPDGMDVTERQIELGKLYWELVKKPAHKEYDDVLVPRDHMPTGGHVKGRVIVDAEGIERHGSPDGIVRPPPPHRGHPGGPPPPPRDQLPQFSPRCGCHACFAQSREETHPLANFEDLDPKTADAPKNDLYYWVLSKDIPAFILGERRWGHLLVSGLKDVKADREAFKYLVLDDEIKLTVKALIGKFASADGVVSPWPRDLVKNKGEGRIFLLHGSPGVGKTCTAECVAELTHRPLLSLTSGDISTDMSAASVERNLNYFLTLGERYGALVLLDEADVYLEERRTKDLHRNGLVSIFLRALEYYRGVLFLTTNRVEAFDAAFTSRIHVALHYRKLTDEDRLRIWNNNFERLERDSGGKVYVGMSTREFAYESEEVRALRWNGREIRNALQTAVALAETEAMDDGCEKVNVTDKHLRAVVKMSRGFKEFLRRRGWETEESESEDSEYDGEASDLMDD